MTGPFSPQAPAAPGAFVLDVSIPVAWCFTTQATVYSSGVLGRIRHLGACVPSCWTLDLAASLRTGERQGLGSAAAVDLFLTRLLHFPIYVESETPARAWPDILVLSRRMRLSVDRVAYLELALRLKLPLATADTALTRAATSAGATTFTP